MLKGVLVIAALAAGSAPNAHASEAAILLAGAETYTLKQVVYAEPGCEIDQQALRVLSEHQFSRVPKLRSVAEESVPDIVLTLAVDVAAVPRGDKSPEMCLYNINLRAIHPMYGKLRYSDKAQIIQALTYSKTIFSIIVPSKVQNAIEIQTGKILGLFFDEYSQGNPTR
jgi:hypothetical protein